MLGDKIMANKWLTPEEVAQDWIDTIHKVCKERGIDPQKFMDSVFKAYNKTMENYREGNETTRGTHYK